MHDDDSTAGTLQTYRQFTESGVDDRIAKRICVVYELLKN